ncbi:NYN domain-containing protein [Synechocystis salina]|uniref:NYN domain-containing protein n=1 Tax=Synechocystis salina LEGE 00031 TaxID=1828736 RepID=A0ABR9VS76_9SYNC|nr:NYN domain-containing protein [Synechocystis salina]MBE9240787.1 NYN domain-containing protein [Synechocystis salina LEGE 00041]MBE9254194.1 NYN domain-containing protein [Synechocystis salina LEGE 00031]
MNIVSLLASGLTLATVGLVSGQGALMATGTAMVTASGASAITVVEQKKKFDSVLRQLEDNFASSQGQMQASMAAIAEQISRLEQDTKVTEKMAQKVDRVHTSNRLVVGKLQKYQRQHLVMAATLEQQGQELEQLQQKTPKSIPPIVSVSEAGASKIVSLVPNLTQQISTTAHIVIDGNNFSKNAQELGLEINWKFLKVALVALAEDSDGFNLKYYGGIYQKPTQAQREKLKHLRDLKYEVVSLPVAQLPNGQSKTLGDDMAIGVDLMDCARSGDEVILVTGDGDFIPLIEKLLDRQVRVKVVGSAQHTNYRLKKYRGQGFEFIALESLVDQIVHLKKPRVA